MAVQGFKPWGPTLSTRAYAVLSTDAHVTYIGDLMTVAGGYATSSAVGATSIIGPSLSFLTASVSGSPLIANDPDQMLETTLAGLAGAITDIGHTAEFLAGPGNLTTKKSGYKLNRTSVSIGNGITASSFEILGFPTTPEETAMASGSRVVVAPTTEYGRRANTGI